MRLQALLHLAAHHLLQVLVELAKLTDQTGALVRGLQNQRGSVLFEAVDALGGGYDRLDLLAHILHYVGNLRAATAAAAAVLVAQELGGARLTQNVGHHARDLVLLEQKVKLVHVLLELVVLEFEIVN